MLDADDLPPEADADAKKPSGAKSFEPPAAAKKAKSKKLKVPNFERFRLILIIGVVVLILLIIGFIFANASLAKATISVKTNATNVDANLNLNLSTKATSVNTSTNTIPAKLVQQQKTYTASEVTTGQQNDGAKAQGTITVSGGSCGPNYPSPIPSGSGFSANGLTYLTQDTITFVVPPGNNHGQCVFQGENSSGGSAIPIIAQAAGSASNTSGTPFTDPQASNVTATGSATGGTDNVVQTVNQNDINNAKAKLNNTSNADQQALENQLQQDGYYAIGATYQAGTPNITDSANVGDVANTVTVTETVSYSMFGVVKSNLATLVDNSVDTQINTAKQSILDNGLDNAVFNLTNSTTTNAQLALSVVAVAGPQLNITNIKQQAEGQKSGQVQTQLQSNPNVTGVTVHLSPFWVTTVPKNPARITVNVAKPTTTAKASSNANNP